ncbi:MAG: hypothetical protein ACREAA_21925 [Candidatus Polarisedimenticolia bacterium]
MNEPVMDRPAAPPANPVSRMAGAITAPVTTFEDVARRPGWLPPFLVYLGVFLVVFAVFSMRADWVAIVTDQIENGPFSGLMPDAMKDQAVRDAAAPIKAMSPLQLTLTNLSNYGPGLLVFFHFLAVLYASLFVMMGSVPNLKLGKAWLNFLVCFLIMIAYFAIYSVGQFAFKDAPDSRVMLTVLGSVVVTAAWIWLLNRRATADPEYHGILSVLSYGSMALMVSTLALLALTLVSPTPIATPPEQMVKAHPGALIKTGIPVLQKLLESLNVFWIWFYVLLTLGFRAVTKLSTGLSASIAFLPWAVVVLISLAMAAVSG